MKTLIRITEPFHEGTTIEKQIAIAMLTNEPIDQSNPITFTKRSDGVLPDYDIRTDKWELAQRAMTAVADKIRLNRTKKMQENLQTTETVPTSPTSQESSRALQ